MKIFNLVATSILITLFASCSASNKTDQTVDDVYYSPGRPATAVQKQDNVSQSDYSYNKEDDNYLRMMVQDRNRWSSIDDYAYWNGYNSTYYGQNTFGYSSVYNNYWNNYSYGYNPYLSSTFYGYGLGYNYNPYAYTGYYGGSNYYNPGVYYKTVRSNTGPRANLGAYSNHTYSNQNFSNSNANHSNYVNGNYQPQTGVGRLLRTIVTGNQQNNTPTYNPARTFSPSTNTPSTNTYTPSSSSSSSSAGSSRSTGSSSGGGRSGHN